MMDRGAANDGLPPVVIDLEKLSHINSGLGQFCLHLGRSLLPACQGRFRPVFFLPESSAGLFPGAGHGTLRVAGWKKEGLQRWVRPLVQPWRRRSAAAVWHVTNQTSKYMPPDDRIPVVLTIHDLNFLHGDVRGRREWAAARKLAAVQRKVRRASVVTTVSRYVADEVQAHLDLEGKPVHVVPSGMAPPVPAAVERPRFLSAGPFLLTVGNCMPHKNFHVLLGFVERMPGARLVIAGSKVGPYGRFIEQEVDRRGLRDRVCLPGEVSDADRQWLYEHCEALVFPSLAEGFGFPVLEALHGGRPVVLTRRTSLPEVAGDHAFACDSFTGREWAAAVTAAREAYRGDPGRAERARAHATGFSWEATARGYVRLYLDLAAGARRRE